MRPLAALLGLRRRRKRNNRLVIDRLHLHDIRPLKAVPGDHAFNRAGRLVLAATAPSGPVKVWEAANLEHAAFLCRVCRHAGPSDFLPLVLAAAGCFLVTEWVAGEPLAHSKQKDADDCIDGMAAMLAAFHRVDVRALGEPGFDYWQQLIRPRFLRAAALVGYPHLAGEVCETVNAYLASAPRRLSHPDLTRPNIVRRPTGALVAIDNELVAASGAPFMDLLNTTRLLSAPAADAFYRAYRRRAPPLLWPPREVERGFWLARETGRVYAAGAITRLAQLFQNYRDQKDVLPLDRARQSYAARAAGL